MNRIARQLRHLRADHRDNPPEYRSPRWLCEAAYAGLGLFLVLLACLLPLEDDR